MRLATWNVNSLKARLVRVEQWIAENDPDIVCLQETKMADAAFPAMAFSALGYDAVHVGQGRWNGVAIVSRVGLDDVVAGFADDGPPDAEARLVWATCGGVRVASCYVPNGRELGHEQYVYKLSWLERLRASLPVGPMAEPLALCGDFNVAPTDADVWDPAEFVGATHLSPAEREAIARLEAAGLVDLFRAQHPDGGVFSWWDYRAGNFHKGKGMRIDLVLASAPLAATVVSATVDRDARKGPSPSDHAPVVIDFAW